MGANLSSGLRRLSLRDETVRAVWSEVLHGSIDRSAPSKKLISQPLPKEKEEEFHTNKAEVPLKAHI